MEIPAARIAFLLTCLAVIVWYVRSASVVHGNNDNDAAYYLGVARHIARTGRLEENIVWTFLARPASVLHRPFTYWQGLTSLMLVPVLMLSHSLHAPFVAMALVSGCTLLLLWYLVTVAAPLRHPIAQAAVLFVFAISPAMRTYRFDTDAVSVMQMWLVASLLALAVKRLKTAACTAFLMAWTRGDGAILCAIVWVACLSVAWRESSPHRARGTALLIACCVALSAAYAAGCVLTCGKIPTPAMRIAPRLTNYFDLYAFGHAPALVPWRDRWTWESMMSSFWTALGYLRSTPFTSRPDVWLVVTLLVGWRKVRWPLIRTVWALLFLGSSAIVLLAGAVFSQWRTPYAMLPLAALAGGAALDDVLLRLGRSKTACWGAHREIAIAAAGLVALLVGSTLRGAAPLVEPANLLATLERDLRELAPTLAGETAASVRPWSIIATIDSPAVMIPSDGETAIADAMRFYGVGWLIISAESCQGTSEAVCAEIRNDTRRELGPFRLEERTVAGGLRLFRLETSGGNALIP